MMMLEDQATYYDLLELAPDASAQEIRAAYLRAKAAYKKDSVALYTLISEEETEALLGRIEEAYQILSSPERRREYDRNHGRIGADDGSLTRAGSRPARRNQKIVSIDRVPPMDTSGGEADILVPPTTDFTVTAPAARRATPETLPSAEVPTPATSTSPALFPEIAVQAPPKFTHVPDAHPASLSEQALTQEIAQEVEWKGSILRKVREARRVAVEEISEYTKISKTYILAIEDENYGKLPAAVYLRGFVTQIAKFLRLPHERVAAAYVARYNLARQAQEKK